ncbi:hypothetical protein AHAS_Ahas04G0042800 [Arachis hypogaea]
MNSIFRHSSSPSRSTAAIITLLKACKTIHHLYQVHASIIQRGLEQDHLIISRFIFFPPPLPPLLHITPLSSTTSLPTPKEVIFSTPSLLLFA